MKKILTVIGARPQFIKASVVSRAISQASGVREVLLHTGQHYDANMSEVFFEQLHIPRPDYQLSINGVGHGEMTGRMLIEVEEILLRERPDCVLVYGDTNSTLAGALAAAKLHIPVAHVEAGLRSFNRRMPEEINRILTDKISEFLFCPTQTAVHNLSDEGFLLTPAKILDVGDVMKDAAKLFAPNSVMPRGFGLDDGFVLATLHRAENTDDPGRLSAIVQALNIIHKKVVPVVMPLHPRTHGEISRLGLSLDVHTIEPVGYLEMIWLLQHAGLILTDSGGVQKEAFFFGKSCVTIREQTEWIELLEIGANELVGAEVGAIVDAVIKNHRRCIDDTKGLFGDGNAARRIVEALL